MSVPEVADDREPLKRQLSVFALWLLMINGMIGAGIFGVPASAERLAGVFSPWVFVICAVMIAPIVLCFAQLASAFQGTGGPMLYARVAFGPFVSFQAGWAYYVARVTSFAANLSLLVASVGYFWPAANSGAVRIGLLLVLSGGLVWINIVGARAAVRSLGGLTVVKLLPLIALAGYGLFSLDQTVFASATQSPAGAELGAVLLLVIYAYVGFESGVVPAGEAKNPKRDMPRALLWALAVSAVLYALIQLAAQRILPDLPNTERALVAAGDVWFGPVGAVLVMAGLVASVTGNLLGSMFSTARMSYRLGLDGQLPAWFGAVSERYTTPANSIAFYGLLAFALAASGSFVWLAVLSVLIRLLLYLLCVASMPAVKRQSAADPDFMRLPGGWLVPGLAVLVCLGLLTQVKLNSVLATLALLAAGSVLYAVANRGGRKGAAE